MVEIIYKKTSMELNSQIFLIEKFNQNYADSLANDNGYICYIKRKIGVDYRFNL
jgi:hypothetical protein